MDLRVQLPHRIISGLPLCAAALMLSASALGANGARMPCDEDGRALKSLDVPVEALTLATVDHVPIDRNAANPDVIETETRVTNSDAPVIYLTPRVASILRDVFGAAEEDLEECGLEDVGVGVIYDYWLDEFAEYLRNRRLRSPR